FLDESGADSPAIRSATRKVDRPTPRASYRFQSPHARVHSRPPRRLATRRAETRTASTRVTQTTPRVSLGRRHQRAQGGDAVGVFGLLVGAPLENSWKAHGDA